MKKITVICGIGAFLLSSCVGEYKKQLESDSITIAQLTTDYNEAATFNDSLMLLMGDIYTGLDSINIQEGLLYNMSIGEGRDRRAEIRNNLSAIRARLASNKELLEKMEVRLKESGNQNSVLAKTIEQMKTRLSQQDEKINMLEVQLSEARDSIDALSNRLADSQEQAQMESEAKEAAQAAYQNAENQLNTVYYAIGTNKELKQNGLLEKKFLGQTKIMKGDFNENYFTKEDKRTFKEIYTGSKKVKIWTNMPQSSYEIVEGPNKDKIIKITDPNAFWSLSPFLIVQVD